MCKAIVNGRKYDTETAELIVGKHNPIHPSNLSRLYRKQNGEFFAYYECLGNFPNNMEVLVYKAKRNIIPLAETEAKALVEEWCDADEYIRLFGDVDE